MSKINEQAIEAVLANLAGPNAIDVRGAMLAITSLRTQRDAALAAKERAEARAATLVDAIKVADGLIVAVASGSMPRANDVDNLHHAHKRLRGALAAPTQALGDA